jgi:protein associated with RNAse G/E
MTVDATAGEVLSLRYLKSDGALHRAFSGQVVGSDSWGTWLLRTADINVEFGDGTQGKFPHPAVTLVPDLRDRWWSLVLPVVDGVCLPTKLYGNVGRPSDDTNAERSALSIIDLELDVVWSDDRFVVVDLDEFEAARNDYAPGVAARAERTANDLVELLAAERSCPKPRRGMRPV